MYSIFIPNTDATDDGPLAAAAWEAGTTGLAEEPGGVRVFFEDRAAIDRFGVLTGREFTGIRRERNIDWAQVSRDAWQPMLVGQRFYVTPPWRNDATPYGRLRLELNPGMACGTGQHPCTQLCLESLEDCVRRDAAVLDVGTGSGILTRASHLLGARLAIGCDVDAEAAQLARQEMGASFFAGSINAVQTESMDVIVANINAASIEELAEDFDRVRKPRSSVILSGFPEWDLPKGFKPGKILRKQEWVCWLC